MVIEEAVKKLLDGDALLFAGAGCSVGALNLRNKPFLQGKKLSKHFANLAGITHMASLEDASEAFIDKYGKSKLIAEIQNEFTAKKIASQHQELGAMPWKILYTTNYDNVLEEAFKKNSKNLVTVTASDNPMEIPREQTLCIHLNGFVGRLNLDNVGKELKLVESSYLSDQLADSPWASVFCQDIRFAQAVFFIGYSLNDLEIKRILIDEPSLSEKCFFLLGKSPDELTVMRAKRFGTVHNSSLSEFCRLVEGVHKTYEPIRKAFSTLSIKEHTASQRGARVTDEAFSDLLLFGKRDARIIFESFKSKKHYLLERSATDELFRLLDGGNSVVVIHSDLGNGKSLFLESLWLKALEHGFRVFEVREHNEEAARELEQISGLGEKAFVTIEEYQDWLTEIQHFKLKADRGSVLILTARNAINDVVYDHLSRKLDLQSIPEIGLDILDEAEINWFIDTLEEYGLWAKFAARRLDKSYFIRINCRGQIHALLLRLLDSPDIGQRLRNLAESLTKNKERYEILLGVCILTLLNQNPSMNSLVDIFGTEIISSSQFRRDPTVKEFIDFAQSEIVVKSPIAAQYILTKATDPAIVVSTMSRMATRIHTISSISQRYQSMFKNFMRFNNVQMVLPSEGKRAAVITYYESIKNLERCKKNPLFWLQYGIASLVIDDLFHSRRYMETAYSYAEDNPEFDTFQIDNHYARLLLFEAIKEDMNVTTAMENFRNARIIINREIIDEKRRYPYKVAANYQPFLDKYRDSLSVGELDEIAMAARDVNQMIGRLSQDRTKHRDVVRCNKAMRYIIKRVEQVKNERPDHINDTSD